MTVIAYKNGIMAADSRLSDSDAMHFTNIRKVFKLRNGALLGTAGDGDDRDMRVLLAKATPRKLPTRAQLAELKMMFSGLLVFPKGQLFSVEVSKDEGEWRGSVYPISDSIAATGHGASFAYGAMEAGKSAIEAVRITCRRDTTCALPVQYEKLAP